MKAFVDYCTFSSSLFSVVSVQIGDRHALCVLVKSIFVGYLALMCFGDILYVQLSHAALPLEILRNISADL